MFIQINTTIQTYIRLYVFVLVFYYTSPQGNWENHTALFSLVVTWLVCIPFLLVVIFVARGTSVVFIGYSVLYYGPECMLTNWTSSIKPGPWAHEMSMLGIRLPEGSFYLIMHLKLDTLGIYIWFFFLSWLWLFGDVIIT